MWFAQPSGANMYGTFSINPVDPSIMVVTFDQDTVPSNSLISSSISGMPARGTIDAIIDPYKFNPITTFGSYANITLGIRYLMLDDVNPSNVNTDGPDAWKNANGTDPEIRANSIVEWNGTAWITIWNPSTGITPTYIQNLRTGIKYRWDSEQWLKAFEGEYAPGYWGFNLDPQ